MAKKEYKITLEEFFRKYDEEGKVLGIYCKTIEQSNILRQAFDRMGKRWDNGKSYLENYNPWCDSWMFGFTMCYLNKCTLAVTYYPSVHQDTLFKFEEVDLRRVKNG